MRKILYGVLDAESICISVDKRTMTNADTNEKLDKKYWIFSLRDSQLDTAWNKMYVELYADYDLNNEAEVGYELLCTEKERNIFKRRLDWVKVLLNNRDN